MSDKTFIDSNIFLYAFSTADADKQKKAKDIVLAGTVISPQVINEVSVNMIKKLGLSENQVTDFIISCYNRYEIIDLKKEIFITASSIRANYKFSYYDSLILSAASEGGCEILYSEDMQHNFYYEKVKIINPFL